MKKIVEGKRYDTETATLIGEYGFVAGTGGPKTRYSVQVEQNSWSGSSDIYPLTNDEALEWAQAHLEPEEVEAEFASMIADA